MNTKELMDFEEVSHFQQILGDWQMVPLGLCVNDSNPLFIKYNNIEDFNSFKNNPIIETIPFFIEIEKNEKIVFICYLFVRIWNSREEKYSLHETAFNLSEPEQMNTCKEIIMKEHGCVLLATGNDVSLIDYTLPLWIIKARKMNINILVENPDKEIDTNFYEYVSVLQQSQNDTESLHNWLKQSSEESHNTVLRFKI